MARTAQDVTETELAVLEVLWKRSQATVRIIADAIYPGGQSSRTATVQKLLERLEMKRCVRRVRSAGVQQYEAAISREELIDRRLGALAERLCNGSVTPLLTRLVKSRRLTAKEREELRTLMVELDGKRSR